MASAMLKRSLKSKVAGMSKAFLRYVNMLIVALAITSMVLQFTINPSPSLAGWGLVLLGIVTAISGIFGTISSGQIGCFGCHLILLLMSSAGLATAFVFTFTHFQSFAAALYSPLPITKADQLIRVQGSIFFVMFSCQMVVLLLATMIHVCGFIDYNEDIDAVAAAREVAKIQKTEEKRHARHVEAAAADRVNKKYKQWSGREDSDLQTPMTSDPRGGAYLV